MSEEQLELFEDIGLPQLVSEPEEDSEQTLEEEILEDTTRFG